MTNSSFPRKTITTPVAKLMKAQLEAMSSVFELQLKFLSNRNNHLNPPIQENPYRATADTATYSAVPTSNSLVDSGGSLKTAMPTATAFECSRGQRELLALIESNPEASNAYCETVALELHGELNETAFAHAWQLLQSRHDGLKLRVKPNGDFTIDFPPGDLEITDANPVDTDIRACIASSLERPLGPYDSPLVRTQLLRIAPDRWLLILTAHHLLADGWSIGLVLSEWADIYNKLRLGLQPDLPEASQWHEFANWFSNLAQPHDSELPVDSHLTPPPPLIFPHSSPLSGFRGSRIHLKNPLLTNDFESQGNASERKIPDISKENIMVAARRCGRLLGVSHITVLLSAYAVFLARLSNQTRLGIGVPIAGHGLAGLPLMVGMASVTMPLDIEFENKMTFRQAVQVIQDELARSRQNAHQLFMSESAIGFPVTALFNIDPGLQLSFSGLSTVPQPLPLNYVKTGLFFNLLEFSGNVLLDFDCHKSIADEPTANRWLQGLLHLIGHSCSVPDEYIGNLSMGPLQSRPNDPELKLVDIFGGVAAEGVPAQLMRVDDQGLWTETGQIASADETCYVHILGQHGCYLRIRDGWIDLAAIDTALQAFEEVEHAVTVIDDGKLTVFVYPAADTHPDFSGIHRQLSGRLTALSLPHSYVLAYEPIRDETGAVFEDRLKNTDWPRFNAKVKIPPRDNLEIRIAAIWQQVLGLSESPGVTDDFFSSGGHSLKAVVLTNRIANSESRSIRLADFFRVPTISGLAELLRSATEVEPIAILPKQERGQPSLAQARMWLLDQFEEDLSAYNMGFILKRTKPLHEDKVRQALQELTNRHESLRSAIKETQGTLKIVTLDTLSPLVKLHDLRGRDVSHQSLREMALQFVNVRVELSRAPLWQAALVLTEEGGSLIVSMHHSIGDNWSITVWMRDFLALLDAAELDSNEPLILPHLPIQYADYAAWHHQRTENSQILLDFWRNELANLPEKILLPSCRPRTRESFSNMSGHTLKRIISPSGHAAFRSLCRERGVTGFEVLTAAWRLWLWGCTGARDVVMGTVHAGRDHPALADQIGLYVNTIPLRIKLDPHSSFLELIDTVRQQAVAAFDHAEMPFNRIVEHLQIPREGSGNPLFEVLIAHDDLYDLETTLNRAGWTAEEVELPVSPFELILTGSEDASGMALRLQYRTALWDENQIGLWLQEIESLLERVCNQPHRALDFLVLPEKLLIPRATLSAVQHFEQWRHKQPQADCVLGETVRSYQDIGAAADALSCRLMASGAVPQEVVAVLVERSWDLPVSVLGIMKARAGFVLLDPAHPIERLAFIVRDAGCRSIVYSDGLSDLAKSLVASFSEMTQGLAITPEPLKMLAVHQAGSELFEVPSDLSMRRDDLAYLIYTSGSTGEPKGVLVDHGALSDHLAGITPLSLWTSNDRSLLFATVAVDAVIEQLMLPLVNGASFCILDSERYSPKAFVETWHHWSATIIDVPPVFWGDLINWCIKNPIGIESLSIKTLMTGGEEMTPQRVKGWYDLPFYCGQILNLFGPTETTCSPIVARIAPHHTSRNRIPIGFPIGGRRIRVLNGEGQEVAIGEEGELLIGRESVAQGYLNQPALTAERFVTDENFIRWYRTGDLVKQRPDGELEYIGRIDRQFKLRGFRIEPGEIEETLRRYEGVQDTAVTFETNDEGGELLAWLVIVPGFAPTRSGILRHLSESLPSHMIPKRFKCINNLPLSRTEKLDRQALIQMKSYDLWDDKADSNNKESADSLEKFCQIMAAVVDVPSVNATDNFFTVGGHSLKAIELVARVREHFGVEIRIKDVFNAVTVAELFEITRALKHLVAQPIKPVSRDLPLPASAGQTRLWLLQSQNPSSVAFNMVAGFVIDDQLNLMALQTAYHGVLARHEVLRTRLVMKAGQLTQVIKDSIESQPILVEEWDHACMNAGIQINTDGESDQPDHLDRVHREIGMHLNHVFSEELNRPFNLASEAPIRLRLIQSTLGFGLVINIHHAAFDGWSATVMLDDLAALYRTACKGEAGQNMANSGHTADGTLKPLSIQYADYSSWQQTLIPSSHREFWLAQFETETLPELRLSVDHPRPDSPSGQGAIVTGTFSQSSAQKLRDLAIQEGVTLFGVLLTLTVVHLYVQSGQTDFIVGTAVAGRDYPELEGQIGFYVNMLPLRCHINPAQPFHQQVRQFGQLARQALLHQDYPFDALVYEVAHKPSAGRQPFFDVVLNMQNFKPMQLVLEGTKTRLLKDRSVSSKYDLMYMIDDLNSLDLYLEYASDLFEPSTAQTLADEFLSIAAAFAMEPAKTINDLLIPWRKKITDKNIVKEISVLKQTDW